MREVGFGQDGSFSAEAIVARANAELANGFGNLAQRVLSMIFKNLDGAISPYDGAEGDNALVAFAEQLASTFRESDVVARLGGDEFVMLLTGESKAHAEAEMLKLSASLATRNIVANRGYDISFSYGLVDFQPEIHHSVEGLLSQADSLMYEHKMQTPEGGY